MLKRTQSSPGKTRAHGHFAVACRRACIEGELGGRLRGRQRRLRRLGAVRRGQSRDAASSLACCACIWAHLAERKTLHLLLMLPCWTCPYSRAA